MSAGASRATAPEQLSRTQALSAHRPAWAFPSVQVGRLPIVRARSLAVAALSAMVALYGLGFGWLAVERHATMRTNAEDLGFTDQVIWNFLRGQAFRMSVYERAEWQTDVDTGRLRRPDSLLAFHVEPILVLLAPLYLVWPDVRSILWLQAVAVALGAVPAYRFARRRLGSEVGGLLFAGLYLLAPPGQWAVLADFHSVALAAPLLMLAIDALDAGRSKTFLLAGLLAAMTKEEVGVLFAGLGVLAAARPSTRGIGLAAVFLGGGWSLLCVGAIIPHYSGAAVSPFTARYAHLGGSPLEVASTLLRRPEAYAEALGRPEVTGFLAMLLLAGGWLGILAPELLLPAGPALALNVLSSSPWMSSGRAHYSASLLPFLVAAAVAGAARASGLIGRLAPRLRGGAPTTVAGLVVVGALIAYQRAGAGPFADGFVAPERLPRHDLARQLAARIPPAAPVSATTGLYPHVSQRASAYLFPTLRDADYVLADVAGDAFPISPGGVHRRIQELLGGGEFRVLAAEDGLLLLERQSGPARPLPDRFFDFARSERRAVDEPLVTFLDGTLELVVGELVPSGDLGPRGPLGTLRTTWRARELVAGRPRPSLHVSMRDGTRQHFYDLAVVWWYPPESWRPGELIRIDVPGLPLREVGGWEAEVVEASPSADVAAPVPASTLARATASTSAATPPSPEPIAAGGAAALVEATLEVRLGELTARIEPDPWRLALLDPAGDVFWQEAALEPAGYLSGPFSYRDAAGDRWRVTRLREATVTADGARVVADTDEPNGRTARIELTSLGPRTVRIAFSLSESAWIAAVGQAGGAAPGERFLGFGTRFNGVDQRGQVLRLWAEDRRDVGFGDATYTPIPFYVSSRGYSLLVESGARGRFDVAASREDRVAWEIDQPEVSVVLSYGPTPRELVQQHAALTGLPPLPPIWAFGVWKTAIGGQEQVLRDAARLRRERVPASAILSYDATDAEAYLGWPHIGYAGRQRGVYRDLRLLTDRLHEQGFKAIAYKNADLHEGQANRALPEQLGLLVRDLGGRAYVHHHHRVSWVDFTNPDAVAWWGQLWRRALDVLGFDGAMLDLGEIVPDDARYADGTTGVETHNRYLGLYARASFEAARAVRGDDFVVFARSGSLGAQRYQSLQWSGDQTITWDRDGIGGLVPSALSMGLSGFPYWHPEVGGYLGVGLPASSERELWFRWLQLGALSPVMRDQYGEHQGIPVEMWSDRETLDAFRSYARLHNSLVPYLYSQALVASRTGLPIVRHLILNAPDDPRAWAEEQSYTLGDDLLVAPVLEEGQRLRTLYLPRGTWVDWWTGQSWEGGRTITVEAPLDRIPLFARAGAILPLAADFDSLAPASDPAVAVWNGDLVLRVVAPTSDPAQLPPELPSAHQHLYDGTILRTRFDGGALTLSVESAPIERSYDLRLPVPTLPARVMVDGSPVEGWDYRAGTLSLSVRAGSFTVRVEP